MNPLVSILIPAYNAERTVAETIRSAVGQTWPNKEIIIVDDGSTDRTAQITRSFVPKVKLISTENRGLSAAVNHAFKHSNGDYIQELDADDLLQPNKIERQLAALRQGESKKILLSSPWAPFYYRTRTARFLKNAFSEDLSSVEWLLRKMRENIHMQNATWLVSRELTEAAGPWDENLEYDQDGEYFARVLVASEGTRFVPDTGIFYRASGPKRVSYIGRSNSKKHSLFRSMKLQIKYLRSLEESDRVRQACLTYLQNWYGTFYSDMPDITREMQALAAQLGGTLEEPRFQLKYAWMESIFGRPLARWAQTSLPEIKSACARGFDKLMYGLEAARKPRDLEPTQ